MQMLLKIIINHISVHLNNMLQVLANQSFDLKAEGLD